MFHHQGGVQIVNVSFVLTPHKIDLFRCVLLFLCWLTSPAKHCEAARNGTVSYPTLKHSGYSMNGFWIKKK